MVVPLAVCGREVLVFDLEHVQLLRHHGIVGVLTGSLPKAPQQNVFLGLPLRLSPYEALWTVKHGLGVLVDGSRYHKLMADTLHESAKKTFCDSLIAEQVAPAKEETAGDAIKAQKNQGRVEILPGVEYIVVNDTYKANDTKDITNIYTDSALTPEEFVDSVFSTDLERHELLFSVFSTLRLRDYYIMPGLRFGGDFVAYPGDPLKFHSHLIVKGLKADQKVELLQLVASGRLATAVKKAWVLMGEVETKKESKNKGGFNESKTLKCFSIEWAGFG